MKCLYREEDTSSFKLLSSTDPTPMPLFSVTVKSTGKLGWHKYLSMKNSCHARNINVGVVGIGLFVTEDAVAGQLISEYIGERIGSAEV